MYLIELIIKKWFCKKEQDSSTLPVFDSPNEENPDEEAYQNCSSHLYMPIDSTADYLSCKNCGHMVKNKKTKDKKYNLGDFNKF